MNTIFAAFLLVPTFLAEGINTGNNDNESWGGLLGVAVIIAAIALTLLIVRGLGRETLDDKSDPPEEDSAPHTDEEHERDHEHEHEHEHAHGSLAGARH